MAERAAQKEDFEKLIEKNADLKIAFKLTQFHLDVQGSERQRVRPAAQLLSHTTATAILWGKSSSDEDYQEVVSKAYAVQLINDWFDVLNSSSKYSKQSIIMVVEAIDYRISHKS